jgi:hypothetical protein
MLLPILLVASLLPSQQASMRCVGSTSDMTATQTQPLRGPGGVIAVLKVSSDDDHGKNTHLCSADYVLVITPGDAGAAKAVDLLTSDADWDRTLSLRLDGFAHDGTRVFGILKERGKYPSTMLFEYNTADGNVQLIDLKKRFAHLVTARCNATFDVIGTTETGAIVVELNSAKPCAAVGRWLINRTGGSVHRLPHGSPIQNLFPSGGDG